MSLRVRLLAAFGYVLVLVLVALVVPLGLNLSERVDAEIKSEATGQAQIVAASAGGRLDDRADLRRLARTAARDIGGRVIIVNRRGRLLADSAGTGLAGASYRSRPEIAGALAGRTAQGERHSDSLDEDLLFTAIPVLEGGRIVGAVRVTQSVEAVNDEIRGDVLALVAVGLCALALGLLVAWVIAGSLARPLRALAATARTISGGELEARATPAGSREQREVTEAFNEMTQRLSRSLHAQREFAANASHQLRTPLTGIRLRVEAAAMKTSDPDVRRDLEAAEREADRLGRVVTALLALARGGEREAAEAGVELARAADQARVRWLTLVDDAGRSLVLRGDADACAEASEDDVAVILDALIENALEHSPSDGEVALEWGSGPGVASIAVLDEGPGIDPAEADRLFERGYRGESADGRGGTGLGLAVVRALAERWGGSVVIENRSEGGTSVTVHFKPRAKAGALERVEG